MYDIDLNSINNTKSITEYLKNNSDEGYQAFSAKLIPNISKNVIIGVRAPIIHSLAKAIKGTAVEKDFLNTLPHRYLEENQLHGKLCELEKDFDVALKLTTDFLPYIDNWATCDTIRPKAFKKDLSTLYTHIKEWLKSERTYTVRYAIGLLNSFYLDEAFSTEHLKLVSKLNSDEYYINMMIAWYFATALCKQYDEAVVFLKNKALSKWTHNKAIQKACESLRISDDKKAYLRTLKLK